MKKVVSDMLQDIAQERIGYSIGEPWRFTEHSLAAVVPLIRVTEAKRLYRLLSERKDEVKVTDTGSIDKLVLTSKSIFPILIMAGEVLTGATQSRTVTISQILMPSEKLTVDCACVYSSKGIKEGQGMTPSVYSPTKVRQALYKGHYAKTGGFAPTYHRDQSEIWMSVNKYSKGLAGGLRGLASYSASLEKEEKTDLDFLSNLDPNYHTPAEDLAGRISETQSKYKDILKRIPKVDHQIGMVLLAMTGLESMEAFEHPDAWEGIRRAILGADADKIADLSDQNGLFEFKAQKARDIILDLLGSTFDEKVVVDRKSTQTLILDTKRFTGEVVTLDDTPIHISFLKKES